MDLEYSCAKHRPLTIPQKHIGNTLKNGNDTFLPVCRIYDKIFFSYGKKFPDDLDWNKNFFLNFIKRFITENTI